MMISPPDILLRSISFLKLKKLSKFEIEFLENSGFGCQFNFQSHCQFDKIGRFFKDLLTIFLTKVVQTFGDFWGYLEKRILELKLLRLFLGKLL